jgi:DNA-binding SARP family transcriptional activator
MIRRIAMIAHYVGATLAEDALRIQLCGAYVVAMGGRRLEDSLPGRQGRQLLAYLATGRRRRASRDELIEAVWPYHPPAAADTALRALTSKLRAVIGADHLEGRGDLRLVLPSGAWIDVEAADEAIHLAESAVSRGDFTDAWAPAHIALNVSRRPFLAGHEAPWIDEHRRHLEDIHIRALECWAATGLQLGGPELVDAERAARTLIAEAPYRESGYRLLMEVLDASGNAAEALRVFELLRTRLADELGAVPGPAVRQLHSRLLTGGG